MARYCRRRAAFTLMEIVLAIALTSVVMYLLTTAIELYLVRVDSSRGRVESAQLARTLLDRIAADLTATRLGATTARGGGQVSGGGAASGGGASSGGGGAGSGQNGGGSIGGGLSGGGQQSSAGGNGGPGGSGGTGSATAPSAVQGLYGTAETIRIDRSAYPNWQRAARTVGPQEGATADDVPVSVRYYFVEGDRMTADELAARGVRADEPTARVGGLYRQVTPTASLASQSDPLANPAERDGSRTEFLAPEVVNLEIAYFDGKKAVETWDSYQSQGLPAGVEIKVTLYEPRLEETAAVKERFSDRTYSKSELVEYRRFVSLPYVSPAQAAEPLLPVAGGNGGGQGGQAGAQGGGSGNNGARQGGGSNDSQGGTPGGGNARQ